MLYHPLYGPTQAVAVRSACALAMQTSLSFGGTVAFCRHQDRPIVNQNQAFSSVCSLQPSHRQICRPLKQCTPSRSRPSANRCFSPLHSDVRTVTQPGSHVCSLTNDLSSAYFRIPTVSHAAHFSVDTVIQVSGQRWQNNTY